MKKKHTHIVVISKSKDIFPKFQLNLVEIKKYVSFLLDLMCDCAVEVSIRFCGEDEMQQANAKFRHKNKPTDVLSFVPEYFFNQNKNFLGDILICVPVCRQQAHAAGHTLSDELLKMIIHAIVHLKGFDHERSVSAQIVMSELERVLTSEVIKKFKTPFFEKN